VIAAAVSALLTASAKGAVAILVVLAVRAVVGRRLPPRWGVALWLVVAVRLVLPVGPASGWSLFGGEALAGVSRLGPWIGTEGAADRTGSDAAAAESAAEAGPAALLRRAGRRTAELLNPSPAAARPLALLWAAGALLVLVRDARDRRRLVRLRALARPVGDPRALAQLDACRRAVGLGRGVELAESAAVDGPALCPGGEGKPALVLLPVGAGAGLGTARLRHVLLHELAHLAHRDLAARRAARFLCALHWFNPLVHLAARALAADQEVAADARAMSALGRAELVGYGETLLALLSRSPAPAHAAPVGFSTTRKQLHRRIAMIASFRPRRRGPALALAAIAFVVTAAVLLTDGAAAGPAGGAAPDGPSTPRAAGGDAPDTSDPQVQALLDMRTIGVAMFAWLGDHVAAGSPADHEDDAPFDWSRCPSISHAELTALLVPRYAEELPEADPWGRPYELCFDREASTPAYRIGIRSAGSDGRFAGDTYVGGPFDPERTAEDLVWIDGFFVRWPEETAEPGS